MRLLFILPGILFILHSSQPGVVYRKPENNTKLNTGDPLPGTRGLVKTFANTKLKIWPHGKVLYRFHPNVGDFVKRIVRYTINLIQIATSDVVKFQQDDTSTKGVVLIHEFLYPTPAKTYKGGCYAYVGYHDDILQPLVLTFGPKEGACDRTGNLATGYTIHEFMHVLGFSHEFQRHDRDQYIVLDVPKIKRTFGLSTAFYKTNFDRVDDNTQNLPFDFRSIMQYYLGPAISDTPGRTGNVSGVKDDTGHFCGLSAGDRNLIERTYYKESRGPQAKLIIYKDVFKIPGETCNDKINFVADEMNK